MNKQPIEDLIDKYALDKLNSSERKQLEELLNQTPNIKKELMIRKDIAKSMEYLGKEDLKEMLDKIHHEEIDQGKKTNLWKWLLPIFLLAIAGLSFYFLQGNHTDQALDDSSHLFASYYEPFNANSQTRGENIEQILNSFYDAYNANKYAEALTIIKPILVEQNNEVLLLSAISAMQTEDFILSHKLFDQILESKDYYYSDHANWYKALSYIKEDNPSEAKDLLIKLMEDPKADHFKEAEILIRKLK